MRTSENTPFTYSDELRVRRSGFVSWLMAERFYVVAVRTEDEGPIVARMILGAKTRTAVVVPTRRDGRLMEGINGGTVFGGERDMEGLAHLG
jgi:hypothetical protein